MNNNLTFIDKIYNYKTAEFGANQNRNFLRGMQLGESRSSNPNHIYILNVDGGEFNKNVIDGAVAATVGIAAGIASKNRRKNNMDQTQVLDLEFSDDDLTDDFEDLEDITDISIIDPEASDLSGSEYELQLIKMAYGKISGDELEDCSKDEMKSRIESVCYFVPEVPIDTEIPGISLRLDMVTERRNSEGEWELIHSNKSPYWINDALVLLGHLAYDQGLIKQFTKELEAFINSKSKDKIIVLGVTGCTENLKNILLEKGAQTISLIPPVWTDYRTDIRNCISDAGYALSGDMDEVISKLINTRKGELYTDDIKFAVKSAVSRIQSDEDEHTKVLTSDDFTYDFWDQTEYILQSPKRIKAYLDKKIYGQDEAKQVASTLLWNHVNGRARNVVFVGPTGCGKTEIFRQIKALYKNVVLYNATVLTGEGWKGACKVTSLWDGVAPEDRDHLIVVLDEADKVFADAYKVTVQNELLKLLEPGKVLLKKDDLIPTDESSFMIDTTHISWVFLGAFEDMLKNKEVNSHMSCIGFKSADTICDMTEFKGYESTFTPDDLIKYAHVRPELAGRITCISQLQTLHENDFYNLLNSQGFMDRFTKEFGVDVKFSDDQKKRLAKTAAENGLGIRYLISSIKNIADRQLYENCNRTVVGLW